MANILLNNFHETGNTLGELGRQLKRLDSRTRCEKVSCRDIIVCYIPDEIFYKNKEGIIQSKKINTKKEIMDSGIVRVYLFDPDESKRFSYTDSGYAFMRMAKLKLSNTMKNPDIDSLIDEMLENRTILYVNGKYCLTSNFLDMTLYQRIGMHGKAMLNHTMLRNAHIAELLQSAGTATAVMRTDGCTYKLCSLMSSKFKYINQGIIMDIISGIDPDGELGEPSCYKWEISNMGADVFLEFPEKAEEVKKTYKLKDDFIPGLLISKSDVGLGSVRISGCWRKDNAFTIFDTVRKEHSGTFDINDVIDEAADRIFGNYTKLPERLCELMPIDITDPNWFTKYSLEEAREKNISACSSVIKNIFKQINLKGAIQKKRERAIFEELVSALDPDIRYTAYDLCTLIMEIPARITGISSIYMEELMKTVGKTPYVSYEAEEDEKIMII